MRPTHSLRGLPVPPGLLGVLLLVLGLSPRAFAASAGDYRSLNTGNWNSPGTWQTYDGSSWVAATSTPTSADGVITIRNNDNVTISAAGLTVDQVTVNGGGTLTVASGITWTLADGAGTDLTIAGLMVNAGGTWSFGTNATWQVDDGGTYVHNTTAAVGTLLDRATLAAASTFIYRGSSTITPPVSLGNRTYGNLTFESTAGSWSFAPNASSPVTALGTFSLGANVTMNSQITGLVTIGGSFTNNGTLNNQAGTQAFLFTGPAATIGGTSATTFEQVRIASGAVVTVASAVTFDATAADTIDGTLGVTNATLTVSAPSVVVTGTFRLGDGGVYSGTALNYDGSASTLEFANTAGAYAVSGKTYWPTSNSSRPRNVNVSGTGGIALDATARTVPEVFQTAGPVTNASKLSVNGTAQVNAGGSFDAAPTFGNNSTLLYNATVSVGPEWSAGTVAGVGVPQNVIVQAGTVTLPTSSRTCPGDVSIAGGTLKMNATAGADLTVGGNWTLTSGGFTPNGRTVLFSGAAPQTLSGATTFNGFTVSSGADVVVTAPVTLAAGFTATVDGALELGAALTASSTLRVNGSLQLNAGGSIDTAPLYGASAALRYNTTINVGVEWGAGTVPGAGVPKTVSVLSGTVSMPAGDRTCPGDFTLSGGEFALSTSNGRDLSVGGNWTLTGGIFSPNGRTVFFNGTTPQTLSGTTFFGGLVIASGANLTILSIAGADTGPTVDGTLQLGATFTSSQNGQVNGTLQLNAGGHFYASGNHTVLYGPASLLVYTASLTPSDEWWAASTPQAVVVQSGTITLSAGGSYSIAGDLTLSGGNLTSSLASSQRVKLSLGGDWALSGGSFTPTGVNVDFNGTSPQLLAGATSFETFSIASGANVSFTSPVTIVAGTTDTSSVASGGTLQLSAALTTGGAPLAVNGALQWNAGASLDAAPRYGSTSELRYNTTRTVGTEWGAGAAVGVGVPGAVTVLSGTITMPSADRTCGGDLTLSGGTLALGTGNGNDLSVGGNWTRNGGTFTPNSRTVFFNGKTVQTLTGATTFSSITVSSGADLSLTSAVTLTSGATVNGTLELGAALTVSSTLLVPGTLQYNAGGSVSVVPTFSGSATLVYNTTQAVGPEWGSGSVVGSGVPKNVTVAAGGIVTMPTTARTCGGNLTIDGGTLTLSTTAGADLTVGGNWLHSSGTFTHNSRMVTFNGTGTQTVTGPTTETFSVLGVNKPSGALTLGSNVTVTKASGDAIVLSNAGTVDLGGFTLLLKGVYANIDVIGGVRTIGGTGTLLGGGGAAPWGVVASSGGSLTTGPGVTITANLFDPGPGLTTIQGTLSMGTGDGQSGVWNNAPIFTAGSTLQYVGQGFRDIEWSATSGAGYPANVRISRSLDVGFNGKSNVPLQCAGDLTVDADHALNLDKTDMTQPLVVGGNLFLNGILSLSDLAGGDFTLRGDWNQSATGTFTPKGRTVSLLGTSPQAIGGVTAFDGLTLDNAGGAVFANDVTVNKTLTLTAGVLTAGTHAVIVGSAGSVARTAGYVNGLLRKSVPTSSGVLSRTFEIGDADRYAPLTLAFSKVTVAGTVTAASLRDDHPNLGSSTLQPTKTANRHWTVANSGVVFPTYDATVTFDPADVDAGADPSVFHLEAFTPPSTWSPPAAGTRTATSTQGVGFTQLGDLATGEATWAITATASTNGTISPPGVTVVPQGGSQTYSFTPDPGYHVSGIYVDGVQVVGYLGIASYTLTNVSADHTVTATFTAGQLAYRSVASGNWDLPSTWESSGDGTTWKPAIAPPDAGDEAIQVRAPHAVTIATSTIADQLTVESGAQLTIGAGVVLTIANGDGTDLTVAGTLANSGALIFAAPAARPSARPAVSGTNWMLAAGGIYIHNTTDAVSPVLDAGTISTASTVTYRGSSTLTPPVSTDGRTYGSLTFESSDGGAWLASAGGAGDLTIAGDFVLGPGVTFSTSQTGTMTFAGNFTFDEAMVLGAGTQRCVFTGVGKSIVNTSAYLHVAEFEAFTVAAGASLRAYELTLDATFPDTVDGTLTLDQGILKANSTLHVNGTYTAIAGAVQGLPLQYGPNGTLEIQLSGGTIDDTSLLWPASGGPANVTIAASTQVNSPRTVPGVLQISANFDAGKLTVPGITQINPGGSATNAPTYTSTSTLIYLRGISNGAEWGSGSTIGKGVPNNVIVQAGNGTVSLPQTDHTCGGDLTLISGTLRLNGSPAKTLFAKGNWTAAGGVFDANGQKVAFTGAARQSLVGPTSFYDLQLNNASGLAIADDITITKSLTLTSGALVTGDDKVVLDSTATVSRTGGQVAGTMAKRLKTSAGTTSWTFAIGDSLRYAPVTVDFPSGITAPGTLTATTMPGDHPSLGGSRLIADKTANRYWSVSNAGLGFPTYNATFTFDPADLDAGANTANFKVAKFDAPATWTLPVVGSRTATSTQATGMTSFSDFEAGEVPSHTITASTNGGGTITPKGAVSVLDGDSKTFTLAPSGGHHLADVAVDGASVGATTSYTFVNVTSDHSISATFDATNYRSLASGVWSSASTWEQFDGTTWSPAITPPDSSVGTIVIRSPHVVTNTTSIYVDQVTIDAGAQVTTTSGFLVVDGPGTDLVVDGTLLNQWNVTPQGTATCAVHDGASVIINTNAGSSSFLNATTLSAGSTFIYRGSISASSGPELSNRTYGNLILEWPDGYGTWFVTGAGPLTVAGDFTISPNVTLSTSQTGVMTFAGNMTLNGTLTNGTGTQIYKFTGAGKTIGGSVAANFERFLVPSGASITIATPTTLASSFADTIDGTLGVSGVALTSNGSLTVNGTFRLEQGATVSGSAFTYGPASTLLFANASGAFAVTSASPFWPSVSGPPNVNVAGAGGINLGAARTVSGLCQVAAPVSTANNLTSTGTVQLNAGATFDAAPTYAGTATLLYNAGLPVGPEWGSGTALGVGVPRQVTVQAGGGSVMLPNADRTCPGDLVLASGELQGASGRTLSVGGNWTSSGGTFTPNGGTVAFTGATPQTMSGTTTFDFVTLANASGLTPLNDFTVNRTLTLTQGLLNVEAHTLTVGATGDISRGTGYVNGALRVNLPAGPVSRLFAIGDASHYAGVQLDVANVTTPGSVTATTTAGDHPAIGSSPLAPQNTANRYWTLTNSGTGFTTYDATFTFSPSDLDPLTVPSTFRVAQFNAPSTWTLDPPGVRTATSTQALGMSEFGDFAVGNDSMAVGGQFTVTASAGAHGSISPAGVTTLAFGALQTYTMLPDSLYRVLDVHVDGVSVGAVTTYTFANVAESHTIDAAFALTTYTITATAGANGSITPSGVTVVNHGDSLTYAMTPADHYHVADVLVDNVSVGAVGTYSFVDVTADHTIAVSFALDSYTITATAGPNGTITPSGTIVLGYGATQVFTMAGSGAYKVADVQVDGASVGAVTSYTFTNVTANHTIAATFALGPFMYRSAASGNWNAPSTWQFFNGTDWVLSLANTPTSADSLVTVRSPHVVTVSAPVTIDQTTVDAGAQLTVASGQTLTLANGAEATDLTLNGTILVQGTFTPNTSSAWVLNDGATYIQNTTSTMGTVLDKGTLQPNSNFLYRGSSTLSPNTATNNRTYGNLSFESTSGSWTAVPSGSGTLTIAGDFVLGSNVNFNPTQTGVMTFGGNFTNNGTITNGSGVQKYTFSGAGKTLGGSSATSVERFAVSSGASLTVVAPLTLASSTATVTGTLGVSNTTLTATVGPVIDGTFRLDQGGVVAGTAFTYGAAGTLIYGNTTGSYSVSAATVEWPVASPPFNVWVSGAGGVTLSSARTVAGTFETAGPILGASLLTIGGTAQFDAGGSADSAPVYGSGATLLYAGALAVGPEWSAGDATGVGVPHHVTIHAGTGTVTLPAEERSCPGTLTLTSGTLAMNGAASALNVGGDWIANGGAFAANSGLVSFNGTAPQNLTGATSFDFATLANAAGLTLADDITVNRTLTLTAGLLSTGAHAVTLGAAGDVTRTSGYIVGTQRAILPLGPSSRTFAIGDDSHYAGVQLDFADVTSPGTVSATTTTGDHPSLASSPLLLDQTANRYWSLTNAGAAFSTYDATFTFDPADLDASADPATFRVAQFDAPSTWMLAAPGARTATSTQALGLASFSDFAVGNVAAAPTYAITATAGEHGTISPSGVTTVDAGAGQTYTMTPDDGYHIADVRVDGASIGAVTVYDFVNVNADHTIEVSFAATIVTYTVTATADAHGTIAPDGVSVVNQGEDLTYTITPDAPYHIRSPR